MTFDEWVEQRLEPLLRFAAVLCGSRQLAEDVVQEVLIKAHRHWERVQAADRPDSSLRRMVVNEYLSWRRRWSRVVPRPEITVTDQHSDPAIGLADRQELLAELAKLPRRQRTVLVLRYYEGYTDYYEGYTDAEIAETLGCAASTVRAHASRALAALRVEMTHADKGATHAH